MLSRVRPQIMMAIIAGTFFGCFGTFVGWQMNAVEIVTGVIGSVFGFLAGVSFKILENE
jgi:uncharacterized membrane protein